MTGRAASPLSVLVRYPDFRRLFTGNSISLLGSSVTGVALPLTAVVYLHVSAAEMGLLGAVALLPCLVLSLPAGVWVDRMPYRRLLGADAVRFSLPGFAKHASGHPGCPSSRPGRASAACAPRSPKAFARCLVTGSCGR